MASRAGYTARGGGLPVIFSGVQKRRDLYALAGGSIHKDLLPFVECFQTVKSVCNVKAEVRSKLRCPSDRQR